MTNNKNKDMTDAQRIITDLRSMGIKREELAYKFGLSYATIARWESGVSEPRTSEFKILKTYRDKYASDNKSKGSAERT